MDISTTESNGVSVVVVKGQVDSATSSQLESTLKSLLENDKTRIVLDLQGVEYMSSMGLRVLVSTMKTLQESDGGLRLCNISKSVSGLLLTVGMLDMFSIYENQDEAIGSF
jgi:anti-anti-sigma factor